MKKQTFPEKMQKYSIPADTCDRLGIQNNLVRCVVLIHGLITDCIIIAILKVYGVILKIRYYIAIFKEYCYRLFIE